MIFFFSCLLHARVRSSNSWIYCCRIFFFILFFFHSFSFPNDVVSLPHFMYIYIYILYTRSVSSSNQYTAHARDSFSSDTRNVRRRNYRDNYYYYEILCSSEIRNVGRSCFSNIVFRRINFPLLFYYWNTISNAMSTTQQKHVTFLVTSRRNLITQTFDGYCTFFTRRIEKTNVYRDCN